VHQPPLRKSEACADPERLAFVRDGFHFWAFLLAPLWLLWHRLWLALVLWAVVFGAAEIGLRYAGVRGFAHVAVLALIGLFVGLEASSLRRWTLALHGWKNIGIVVGDNLESAERRFISEWIENAGAPAAVRASASSAPMRMSADRTPEVIGLFPEPGRRQ
ncbi:MAG: DUF2628 domain-containing protein, partial [Pseudomonadota bacterium]|nr:DUF2628 domain-containing protein [Pseudomonadota bacterium]